MALSAFSFPLHLTQATPSDPKTPTPLALGSHSFCGADLLSQSQHRLNQVRKRPHGVYASLSEMGEYHSKKPPTPLLDTINYPLHMKNLSTKGAMRRKVDQCACIQIFG